MCADVVLAENIWDIENRQHKDQAVRAKNTRINVCKDELGGPGRNSVMGSAVQWQGHKLSHLDKVLHRCRYDRDQAKLASSEVEMGGLTGGATEQHYNL